LSTPAADTRANSSRGMKMTPVAERARPLPLSRRLLSRRTPIQATLGLGAFHPRMRLDGSAPAMALEAFWPPRTSADLNDSEGPENPGNVLTSISGLPALKASGKQRLDYAGAAPAKSQPTLYVKDVKGGRAAASPKPSRRPSALAWTEAFRRAEALTCAAPNPFGPCPRLRA
jgi:hypothetical protein